MTREEQIKKMLDIISDDVLRNIRDYCEELLEIRSQDVIKAFEPICSAHKYHCGTCNRPLTFSPANYASRPQDIPNPCEYCFPNK
jgi:hypothetical protein